MPRIKRWFPVSHDINGDPEFCELCDTFGVAGVRVWLELLSIADRNEGDIPGSYQCTSNALPMHYQPLTSALAGRCQSTSRQVLRILQWLSSRLWIESQSPVRIRNYAKYHVSRDAKEIPQGEQTTSPPSYPSLPSLPSKDLIPKGISSPHRNGHGAVTLHEWPASDFWLKEFLDSQTLIPAPRNALLDPDWWEQVSHAVVGISLELLQREFAKMGAWLRENPSRSPGTARGWKRFVRQWLERAHEKERRFPRGN